MKKRIFLFVLLLFIPLFGTEPSVAESLRLFPFVDSTSIEWYWYNPDNLPTTVEVAGQQVAELVNEFQPAGSYQIIFNGSGLASGTYIYRLTMGQKIETKKMSLIK